jgi:hypothetical protein
VLIALAAGALVVWAAVLGRGIFPGGANSGR